MTPVDQSTEARQETGGLFRRQHPAARSRSKGADTEARIVALEGLTTADLRIEWSRMYRATPPTRLSRNLLLRGVAHKVQEHAHGGLSLGTQRMLRSLCEGSDQRGGPAAAPAVTLKPGTKLVREWHGRVHTVSVLDDGLEFQGECYRSLTAIARQITGSHWSGPMFFGLKRHPSPASPKVGNA
jgi:Protein of unknown function (DUF2924)